MKLACSDLLVMLSNVVQWLNVMNQKPKPIMNLQVSKGLDCVMLAGLHDDVLARDKECSSWSRP